MSRKEENTQKILDAAIKEFVDKGFSSATMEGIASGAHLTRRTLYKYFPQKELIFDAIVEKLLSYFEGMSNIVYEKNTSIEDQIYKLASNKVELCCMDEYVKVAKLVIGELLKAREIKPEHFQQFAQLEAPFIKWIEQAKQDGKVISDMPNELIANQFHSIIKGQIHYPILYGMLNPKDEDKALAKRMATDFFLKNFC